MAVEREEIERPFAIGKCAVSRAVRQANGEWFVEFEIDFRVRIDDTRDVYVRRSVSVRAEAQRGRKVYAQHPGLPGPAFEDVAEQAAQNPNRSTHTVPCPCPECADDNSFSSTGGSRE